MWCRTECPGRSFHILSKQAAGRKVSAITSDSRLTSNTRSLNTMRVLVLGAAGFVGNALIEALARTEWATPIAAFHRRQPVAGRAIASLAFDATSVPAVADALQGVDVVVNCVSGAPAIISAEARALFAAAARQSPLRRIVHLSSMAVYGTADGVFDETAAQTVGADGYASAKIEAERIAAGYGNCVILRPSCIYGPGSSQWSERIAVLLRRRELGDLGPAGEGFCNLVYVSDVVRSILKALRIKGVEGQAYNISSTRHLTWNQYFHLYAQALGLTSLPAISGARLKMHALVLAPAHLIALRAGDAVAGRHSRHYLLSPALLRLFRQRIEVPSNKAEAAFSPNWTALAEGLAASTAAYPEPAYS